MVPRCHPDSNRGIKVLQTQNTNQNRGDLSSRLDICKPFNGRSRQYKEGFVMNVTFWIVYVIFGIIAQVVTIYDMIHCISARMAADPDITFHADNLTTGERIDIPSTELNGDDEIVRNVIEQNMDVENTRIWKEHPVRFIGLALLGLILWPIVIPLILWSVHKYTDSYVEDIVTSNQES